MCDGNGGAVDMQGPMYNTTYNTIGIGDPIPPGHSNGNIGSGDRFGCFSKPASKKQTGEDPLNRPLVVYSKSNK